MSKPAAARAPAPSLRERNKAKRRDAVLDAALALLDDPRSGSLTTEQIAEGAQVSVATVYNLVGTREELLVALLDRVVAELVISIADAPIDDDPVAVLRHLIDRSVDALTSRPTAYRAIVRQLTASESTGVHTKLSPAAAAGELLRQAQQRNVVLPDLDADALAMQIYLSYNGALLRWSVGALSDTALRAAAHHGLLAVLAAAAAPRARTRLVDELRSVGARLAPVRERSASP
ncbi:MAG TPA: TetR/AcrR family transcriptional regulator [Acidimicrobiales bacterium]|nr:TetR/AcrR family transcriptional regulator [Acidimicrobiales bacterium]